jgi:hypothetical protein
MEANQVQISVKGRKINVPSLQVEGRTIVVSGRWLKIASIKDADWLEGEAVKNPEACIEKLKQKKLNTDIFTFAQKIPNTKPNYSYYMEWDNVAAIPASDYSYWWEHRLPQETRKNVRRAGRRGVILQEVQFSDQLLHGIVEINNETPLRQGRPFWHYKKSFEVVKKDYSTLLDRCEFLGAYYENKLIGFIKMIYMGEIAAILQLLCMNKHYDKRPANALIARAVEICHTKGLKYLIYGKYIYGNNNKSPLTEFKRRNGFEQVLLPRYYISLTTKGRMAVHLRLHHGLKRLLPENIMNFAGKLRSRWYEKTLLSGNKYISE